MERIRLLLLLFIIGLIKANDKTVCPPVTLLDGPVNVLNSFIDRLFNLFDLEKSDRKVLFNQILANQAKTSFKMLMEIKNEQDVTLQYIGLQTRVIESNGKKQQEVFKFIMSEVRRDVEVVFRLDFNQKQPLSCPSYKDTFIDYYVKNTFMIKWISKYFDIGLGKGKELHKQNQLLVKQVNLLKQKVIELQGQKGNTSNINDDEYKKEILGLKKLVIALESKNKEILKKANESNNKLFKSETELKSFREKVDLLEMKLQDQTANMVLNDESLEEKNQALHAQLTEIQIKMRNERENFETKLKEANDKFNAEKQYLQQQVNEHKSMNNNINTEDMKSMVRLEMQLENKTRRIEEMRTQFDKDLRAEKDRFNKIKELELQVLESNIEDRYRVELEKQKEIIEAEKEALIREQKEKWEIMTNKLETELKQIHDQALANKDMQITEKEDILKTLISQHKEEIAKKDDKIKKLETNMVKIEDKVKQLIIASKKKNTPNDPVITSTVTTTKTKTVVNKDDKFQLQMLKDIGGIIQRKLSELGVANMSEIEKRELDNEITKNVLDSLSTDQIALIREFMNELAIKFKTEPINIYSLSIKQLLRILNQIKAKKQGEKEQYERELKRTIAQVNEKKQRKKQNSFTRLGTSHNTSTMNFMHNPFRVETLK